MRNYLHAIIISVLCFSMLFTAAGGNLRLEEGRIDADSITGEIPTPSVWGPPAEMVLDIPGEDVFIPYFEYAGSNFALARYNGSMAIPDLFLTSSTTEIVLEEELIFEEGLMSGSPGVDILLRDNGGNILCVEVHSNWSDARSLTSDDIILRDIHGGIAVGDVTGDGHSDILHLVPNGSFMEIFNGPFNEFKGKAVLALPEPMEHIAAGMDLTGDGTSEMVLWKNNGNRTTLMIYYGYTVAPMAVLNDRYEIRSVQGGDLDGNMKDDLFLQHAAPGTGEIKVLLDGGIDFDTDIASEGFTIYGNETHNLTGEENLLVKDLDGDGISDIVVGVPDSDGGKGKVMIQYEPGTYDLDTVSGIILEPQTDIIGSSSLDNIGRCIIVNDDLDRDLLPDIIINRGEGIAEVKMPLNHFPSSVSDLYFGMPGLQRISGELGSLMDITCDASGGNDSIVEVLKANISVEGRGSSSWIYLIETLADSSRFRGRLLLGGSSIPGRSVGVAIGDTVNLEVLGTHARSIRILGVEGQDDPPVFLEYPEEVTALEQQEVRIRIDAADPEGMQINWTFEDLPGFIDTPRGEYANGRYYVDLIGTPGNSNVGWNNFTVTATASNSGSVIGISLIVRNIPPYLDGLSSPIYHQEGEPFQLVGLLDPYDIVEYNISMTGPSSEPWLRILDNRTIMGIPENKDVGIWDVNISVGDGNGGVSWTDFKIYVTNVEPDITAPDIPVWRETERSVLDFNSTYEGDGLTHYELVFSTVPVEFDNETGIVTISDGTFIDQDIFRVSVDVLDGHRESTRGSVRMDVINLRPELTNFNEIRTTFKAGESSLVVLELNHRIIDDDGERIDPGNVSFGVDGDHPDFLHWGIKDITIYPWNIDAGDHRVVLYIEDWEDVRSTYVWDLTVKENNSFEDPEVNIKVLGKRDDEVHLDIEYSSMTDVDLVRLSVGQFSETDLDHVKNIDVPYENPVLLDISGYTSDIIYVKAAIMDPHGRETSTITEVQIDKLEDPDGESSSGWVTIVVLIVMVIVLFPVVMMVFMERPSFVIQSYLMKGGEVLEEEVIKPIQSHPGITFTELLRNSDIDRKDLLATIDHLEVSGRARYVNDGTRVRFYPMMGSFVDGPLALNRYQEKVMEIMYRTRNLTLEELSEATGFTKKKLERELESLILKGSVEKRNRDDTTIYDLTSKMKARMRRSRNR